MFRLTEGESSSKEMPFTTPIICLKAALSGLLIMSRQVPVCLLS